MEHKEVNAIQCGCVRLWTAKAGQLISWANLAGTSPTNITRFLKDAQHVPSSKTISKRRMLQEHRHHSHKYRYSKGRLMLLRCTMNAKEA